MDRVSQAYAAPWSCRTTVSGPERAERGKGCCAGIAASGRPSLVSLRSVAFLALSATREQQLPHATVAYNHLETAARQIWGNLPARTRDAIHEALHSPHWPRNVRLATACGLSVYHPRGQDPAITPGPVIQTDESNSHLGMCHCTERRTLPPVGRGRGVRKLR